MTFSYQGGELSSVIEVAALEGIATEACANPALAKELLQLAERFLSTRLEAASAEGGIARSLDALLGPIKSVHSVPEADVAIFGRSNKAAVKFKDGAFDLFDTLHLTDSEKGGQWMLYHKEVAGTKGLASIKTLSDLNLGFIKLDSLVQPNILGKLLRQPGLDDEFLSKVAPNGTVPLSYGVDRVALLTPANDVVLLGQPGFRPPAPNMLFPKAINVNQKIQAEVLDRADTSEITRREFDGASKVSESAGWRISDPHYGNLGRLDGKLKLLDSGAVERTTTKAGIDHNTALRFYKSALSETASRSGADSAPFASLSSEYGWHHRSVGNMQSAEEHLATALPLLEKYGDWKGASLASQRLAGLYKKREAAEFIRRSALALNKYQDWSKSVTWK
jgi:hypothetical protein